MNEYDISVTKLNESFIRVISSPDIAYEISEAFTFDVPGAKFMPKFKAGIFDGKIRIFNIGRRTLPFGLINDLSKFAEERGYSFNSEIGNPVDPISRPEIIEYIDSLGFMTRSKPIEVRDYQINGIEYAINNRRGILVSATGSGKSLITSVICRYLVETYDMKVLIVVPTIGLTSQMKGDFADYFGHTGWSADDSVHCISAGASKKIDKPITVSTFQSIYKMDSDWLNQFGCIIADEAHKVIAKTITGIFEKATAVQYKLGCTGTIHDTKCNMLVMKGITGPVYDVASTAELIRNKQLVPLNIKAIVLNYAPEVCKAMHKIDYDSEIKYITNNSKRNSFIANLALKCTGTTLVLFRFIDSQGKPIYDLITERSSDRSVHYIAGEVKGSDRELIRKTANDSSDIIVASFPTMATGINLPAIENVIFAHPTKSPITIIQSIGRGLRLKEGKTQCNLFDISDNFTYKKTQNTTYRHLSDRLKTYAQQEFKFTVVNVDFK